jgi:hypothetical protein
VFDGDFIVLISSYQTRRDDFYQKKAVAVILFDACTAPHSLNLQKPNRALFISVILQHTGLKSILGLSRKVELRGKKCRMETVVAYFKAAPSPGSGVLPKLVIYQLVQQSAIGSCPETEVHRTLTRFFFRIELNVIATHF